MPSRTPKILLLTTQDPSTIKAEWPFYQNWTLPECIRQRGGVVYIRNWRDESLDIEELSRFDKITFLWANNYHEHGDQFVDFLKARLLPAQQKNPALVVANDAHVILWNTDKATYLPDLHRAGFKIPETTFIHDLSTFNSASDLGAAISSSVVAQSDQPVVLKPSISGSSKGTYLLRDPSTPTTADLGFLSRLLQDGVDGSLIVQAYEPAITRGEFSLVFIAGKHTHTMVKKPAKGEFKCQAEFGGSIYEISHDEVPPQAKLVALNVMDYMDNHVGPVPYCRVDGVLRDSDEFVLMEIEAIEPHLWLETCNDQNIREMLYDYLLQ